jgi:hypothetical protein
VREALTELDLSAEVLLHHIMHYKPIWIPGMDACNHNHEICEIICARWGVCSGVSMSQGLYPPSGICQKCWWKRTVCRIIPHLFSSLNCQKRINMLLLALKGDYILFSIMETMVRNELPVITCCFHDCVPGFHISWIQIQVFQCMKVVRPAHLLILSTLKNLPALCQILGNIMFSYFLLGGCGGHLHVSLDLAWTQFLDGCSWYSEVSIQQIWPGQTTITRFTRKVTNFPQNKIENSKTIFPKFLARSNVCDWGELRVLVPSQIQQLRLFHHAKSLISHVLRLQLSHSWLFSVMVLSCFDHLWFSRWGYASYVSDSFWFVQMSNDLYVAVP